ncbi:MAG TPA: SDR family NAD(P)-dependent oxidoreductase, partial [Syntrophales bacterium]|nr:SDR family NAD(P)-dependent oxidoreductase [Syntrophales bacterium]
MGISPVTKWNREVSHSLSAVGYFFAHCGRHHRPSRVDASTVRDMRSAVMGKMQGKVILITGGSSGIGKVTAKAFALEGAKVVIASRGEEKGKDAVREIRALGGEAFFVRTDVSQEDQVKNLVKMAVSEYGRVDFAFNNAGVEGQGARLAKETMEMWNAIMDINLKGVWLCMKYEI